MDKILNVEDVIKILRVDADTIVALLQSGQLDGLKIGTQWRIRESDLAVFLEKQVESQRVRSAVEKLSNPKWWAEIMKSEYPDVLKQIKEADFPEGTMGAFLKKGLASGD